MKGTDQNCWTRTPMDENGTWSNFAFQNQSGKFDLGMKIDCIRENLSEIRKHRDAFGYEYSVLIISSGVHDEKYYCGNIGFSLSELFELLWDFSGPSMFIIWKTHGPYDNHTLTQEKRGQEVV